MNDLKQMFGCTGKDVITGFQGVITGACAYISGCDQVLLAPKCDKDGKMDEGKWFDTSRIEILLGVERIELPKDKVEAAPGPDKPAPVR